jgi:hypothetical protein
MSWSRTGPEAERYGAGVDAGDGALHRRAKDAMADASESETAWSPRKLAWTCRIVALFLGLLQAWAFRYEANPDGVSYLDVADAYREGRWGDAPNGYWGPLYSWLLATGAAVFRLPASADFVLAHIVNFAAFVAALVAFEYFLRGIHATPDAPPHVQRERQRDWRILGYALFLWATLGLISLGRITPDTLLAAAAFMVAGLLVRIRQGPARWRHAGLLGVVAGAGYLTKLAFLPVMIVFLAVAVAFWRRHKRAIPMVLFATACFAVVAAPYAVALSRAKGRFTLGETGRIAYAWMVNGVRSEVHWQGGPPSAGVPAHPTRQISVAPEAYEFATPLRGTYPPWYDPSYWYDGVKPHLAPLAQARIALGYLPLILELHAPLLLLVVAIVAALRVGAQSLRNELSRGWWLIVPGMAGLGMYASVLLDTRYVAPFVVMVWVGVLLVVEPFAPTNWRRGLWVGAATVLILAMLPSLTPRLRALLPGGPDLHAEHAAFVLQSGVRAGDDLALIGDGSYAYWARLARVKLVAEIPARSAPDHWRGGTERQQALLEAFRRAGAVAVVAVNAPRGLESLGWHLSPDGKLAVLRLPADRR